MNQLLSQKSASHPVIFVSSLFSLFQQARKANEKGELFRKLAGTGDVLSRMQVSAGRMGMGWHAGRAAELRGVAGVSRGCQAGVVSLFCPRTTRLADR